MDGHFACSVTFSIDCFVVEWTGGRLDSVVIHKKLVSIVRGHGLNDYLFADPVESFEKLYRISRFIVVIQVNIIVVPTIFPIPMMLSGFSFMPAAFLLLMT